MEGRFDIGTRRMLKEDVKVASPAKAPPAPAQHAPAQQAQSQQAPAAQAFAPPRLGRPLPPMPSRQIVAQNEDEDETPPRRAQPMRITPPAERLLPPGRVGEATRSGQR